MRFRISISGRKRGTALAMMVMLSVILTGLVLTVAWATGVSAESAGMLARQHQAFYAAEAGAQRVAWYVKKNRLSELSQPYGGTINGATYSVRWTSSGGSGWTITSVGTNRGVQETISVVCTPGAATPAIALGGGMDVKNLTINGNYQATGSVSCSHGHATVNGNVTYAGSFDEDITVNGTAAKAANGPAILDYAAIRGAAGQTYTGSQFNRTFDFTALGGSRKVIYVNGDVVNPNFIGSGTLLVSGSITITDNNDTVGSASAPVHLVAQQAISTIGNSFELHGSLYAGTIWIRKGIDIQGVVNVGGDVIDLSNPSSTITLGTPPWFDPRTGGGGGGMSFTKFAGAMP